MTRIYNSSKEMPGFDPETDKLYSFVLVSKVGGVPITEIGSDYAKSPEEIEERYLAQGYDEVLAIKEDKTSKQEYHSWAKPSPIGLGCAIVVAFVLGLFGLIKLLTYLDV